MPMHPCALQLAAEAEAAKARVEGELLATAKIASSMEARLREAQAAADAARSAAASADRRAYEVSCLPPHMRWRNLSVLIRA